MFHFADLRVQQALEAIYLCSDDTAPETIEGCPCCISTRGVDVLLTTTLRDIPGEALYRYVSEVFLTIGCEEDFQYLLARIFAVSANDTKNANDPEIVLGKLKYVDWRSWSNEMVRAIEDFVDAWFERELARDLTEADDYWIGTNAESVLCGAAIGGFDLSRWLIRLNDPCAVPVLADLKNRFPGELSAFWEETPKGFKEFSVILAHGQS